MNNINEILSLNQDLKDLEILDSINELEDISESWNDKNINLSSEYPYIIFNTSDLVLTLNLCSKLVLSKSNNFSYNTVALVPNPKFKQMYFYITNELSHYRYKTELLGNSEEMFNDLISIPILTLQKLVKLMGNKILIYKKDNNFYIRLQNGDLLLDSRPSDENIIFFPSEPNEKICEIKLNILNSIIEPTLPLLNSEIAIENKRLNFTGEKAYFNSSFFYIESNIKSPRISISIKDSEFISKLAKYYKDETILLFNTKSDLPRIYLKCKNVEYEFISSVSSISDLLVNQMNSNIKDSEFKVNYLEFYKIINLATILPSSTGYVKLKHNKNSIDIILSSSKGDSKFNLETSDIVSNFYNNEILCRASLLKKLLLPFSKSEEIELAFNNTSICVYNKSTKAILITYN